MRIAVVVPHRPFFGNILTQFPLFKAIQTKYPEAKIDVWSKTEKSVLIIDSHFAHRLIDYKNLNFFSFAKQMRAEKYEQIYNINSGSEKVHIAQLFSGCKSRFALSGKVWHENLYTQHQLTKKGEAYIANTHLSLFNLANNSQFKSTILIDQDAKALNSDITLLPGGGAGEFKRWPISHYCELVLLIAAKNKNERFIFVLGPDENSYIEVINRHLLGKCNYQIENSPNYNKLLKIVQKTKLAIANDCGPMHLFQMCEVPIITLWGWKNNKASPYNTLKEWFYATEHSWAICPAEEHKAINKITVERVYSTAIIELNRKVKSVK